MKACVIPIGLLAAILGFSLWAGRYVEVRTDHWIALLETADEAAAAENWREAEAQLQGAYRDWEGSQTFFHTIMAHEGLMGEMGAVSSETLFVGAAAVCRERDDADFHLMLAQLTARLRLLAETQSVSIKNVF